LKNQPTRWIVSQEHLEALVDPLPLRAVISADASTSRSTQRESRDEQECGGDSCRNRGRNWRPLSYRPNLGLAGFKLRLHDIDEARLCEVRARGGVDVEGPIPGFAAVEQTTSDLRSALDGADVIIVVTGANNQAAVARSAAPLLQTGQVILLIQGNTGGSLVVRHALDDAGCRAEVDVAEMDNYPYSCWRLSATRIRPIVRKQWLQIATFPGERIDHVFPRLAPLFPEAVAAPNILYTGFTNANAMLHVANCVANAGRIESGESYKFYAEGVTPAVARLYEAINAERVAVGAALGASVSAGGQVGAEGWSCRSNKGMSLLT
jgi:opine dehydrogenase